MRETIRAVGAWLTRTEILVQVDSLPLRWHTILASFLARFWPLRIVERSRRPHHPQAWEEGCFPPNLDSGGENSAMAENLERLKQRVPLLEYLQRHNWKPCRTGSRQEFVGLCPLHQETHPSFYVNAAKNLFYCHGCGRGGDLIRFVQLFLDLPFRQTVAHLEQELLPAPVFRLLEETVAFYQLQLHRHPEATDYLERRGVHDSSLIEELGIGYAPGGNLRRHLAAWCSSFDQLLEIGLINHHGRDAFCRRLIFPCRQNGQIANLYGRSIGAAFPHRLLPRSKGGLFAWESVSRFSTVILVEGLFDLAVLWQAGFRNTTCAIGTQLTPAQVVQLAEQPGRSVYIAFDQDDNQAGQKAADQLAHRLQCVGMHAHIVQLPEGLRSQQLLRRRRPRRRFYRPSAGSGPAMKFSVVYRPSAPASASPWRVLDERGREVAWANTFLDVQRVRQLSLRSLRAYAFDLLHFARWGAEHPPLSQITESTLLDYARHQLDQQPKPAPQTINHRLGVLRCLYRFHYGQEIPGGHYHFQRFYKTRPSLGDGQAHRAVTRGLRLRQPRRVVVPLCAGRSGPVLAQLSHLSRSRPGGLDVTGRSAFL